MKQYIRNSKNEKIGIITATIVGNKALIGYSKCNKMDKFNRDIGEIVADVRAKDITVPKSIPHAVKSAIPSFLVNHENALEGLELPVWVKNIMHTANAKSKK